MRAIDRLALRRVLAVAAAVGLLASMGVEPSSAKTAPCKKGFVRNKARKCVKRRPTTTTVKRTTATTARPATPTASKGTLKFGSIGTSISTTNGTRTLEEARKIGEAWVTQTNAAGGINGYKVQMIYRDSRADTARGVQGLKEMEKEGVLAIVGQDVATTVMPASDDFLSAKKLPVIGGNPYTPEFDTHPMYFPVSAGYYAGVYGQVALARDMGSKYFRNLFCTEVAACAQSVPVTNAAAQREGMKSDSQGASAVAADYTANCLDAKQKGVDFLQNNGTNFANLIRDCARQNYHPNYAQGGAANQAVIDASKGENVGGQLYEFGVFYDGPEVARFRKAVATTDLTLGGSTPATQTSVHAWLGWEMAGAAIKKLTQANPTRADFLNALYSIKGETLGGQAAPADYTTQKNGTHAYNDCWTEATVKDGKFFHIDKSGQIVNKLTFICGTGHYPVQNVG